MISPRLALWALAYGLLIWFEATLIIRWAGDLFFVPGNTVWTIGGLRRYGRRSSFAIGWFFFAAFQDAAARTGGCRDPDLRRRVLSPMRSCSVWIDNVFPAHVGRHKQRLFASWLAWAYGIGLISGMWPQKLLRVPAA